MPSIRSSYIRDFNESVTNIAAEILQGLDAGTLTITNGSTTPTLRSYINTKIAQAPGFPDAPDNGTPYVRQDKAWTELVIPPSGIADEPGDGTPYVRQWNTWQPMPASGIGEANIDGLPYLRKDGTWEAAPDFAALSAGLTAQSSQFILASKVVKRDPFMGIPDGIITDFQLAQTPVAGTVEVFKDGLLTDEILDYTIVSGNIVRFVTPPTVGSRITINYILV